ncbi:ATP-binding protein [Arcticibacter eurypsychrophilus]|uniref:ATP-binding protein n=1 Tax=Arcticibacter eurypsychrophilus TaxID=1434752 RepID=UPI00084DA8B7|nr:ATP-binding protein [Arcticibacter eurypsychrophilus]
MNKYPIGIQDFEKIRTEGFVYIDKTRLIHKLIDSGSYYFLSRPRRFGKSLLLSTIKQIFTGNQILFEGFWIHDQWNWTQKHPVIHLRLSSINYQKLGLYKALNKEMDVQAAILGVSLVEIDLKDKFKELIEKTSQNGKVVILIDEYDKPVIDYLDDIPTAEENRLIFKSFYSVLKDADEYIRFLLITGVTRFTKISIFSDLNNLRDITLAPDFGTIAGITQAEVEKNFAHEIAEMQKAEPNILDKIKQWYNGYSWNGVDKVYNPFSLLNFMTDKTFSNYWFETGTPSFLVKQIKDQGDYNFENIKVGKSTLGKFDVKNMLSIPLLFQTGYLTVKAHNAEFDLYTLGYPNKEVELSLLDNLLSAYREVYPGDSAELTTEFVMAFRNNDISLIFTQLDAMIASIPYDHWKADHESIFHIIAHLTFKIVSLNVHSEVHSAKGRSDITVYTDQYIYVLELKLDDNAQVALDQIFERGYLNMHLADKRKKIAIGVNFSSEKRAVDSYVVKEVV